MWSSPESFPNDNNEASDPGSRSKMQRLNVDGGERKRSEEKDVKLTQMSLIFLPLFFLHSYPVQYTYKIRKVLKASHYDSIVHRMGIQNDAHSFPSRPKRSGFASFSCLDFSTSPPKTELTAILHVVNERWLEILLKAPLGLFKKRKLVPGGKETHKTMSTEKSND